MKVCPNCRGGVWVFQWLVYLLIYFYLFILQLFGEDLQRMKLYFDANCLAETKYSEYTDT